MVPEFSNSHSVGKTQPLPGGAGTIAAEIPGRGRGRPQFGGCPGGVPGLKSGQPRGIRTVWPQYTTRAWTLSRRVSKLAGLVMYELAPLR